MSSRASAKQAARQRLAAEAAAAAARDRRSRTIKIVAGVAVLVLAVVGGIVYQMQRTAVDADADPGPQVSSELLADGIAVGDAEAPVVDIYLDFLCSHCAEMEERVGDTVADLALEGEARIVIHPITLLDPTESARSAAAFGCAAGTDSVLGFQKALFDNAGGGFSTERLVEIGASVGLTDAEFVQCVEDDSQAAWAEAVNTEATERGVVGTPTIFVDGTKMNLDATSTDDGFRAEIEALSR
jgi:protein-disulfide isomerase